MICEKLLVSKDNPQITLTSYLIEDSAEYRNHTRPAVIVCPGGAYIGLSDREGEPVALAFLAQGYNAFVLRYSTDSNAKSPVYPACVFDLARAVATVRENAEKWHTDKDKIALAGFSAGGNLIALYGNRWQEQWVADGAGIEHDLLKPNALILGYPFMGFDSQVRNISKNIPDLAPEINVNMLDKLYKDVSQAMFGDPRINEETHKLADPGNYVGEHTPPTFIWHTSQDVLVSIQTTLLYAKRLADIQKPFELHIYERGAHGMGLGIESFAQDDSNVNVVASKWIEQASTWLKLQFGN